MRIAVSHRASTDAEFDPTVRRKSQRSTGSTDSQSSCDEEFAPAGLDNYGGIIRLGRQWHGVSPITDGTVAWSHECTDLIAEGQSRSSIVLQSHGLAQARLCEEAFEQKVVEAAEAVAAVYHHTDGPMIETAVYIGIVNEQHIALTCSHGQWQEGMSVLLCFNSTLANHGMRGKKSARGRCLKVDLNLDLVVIQILEWKFPVPRPVEFVNDSLQLAECVWGIIYHATPTPASFEKFAACYQSYGKPPDISEASLLLRPLQKAVSPGAYTGDAFQVQKLVTCTLFHGASGGPGFVLRGDKLLAAMRVQSGFHNRNRNAMVLYSPEDLEAVNQSTKDNAIIE